MKFKLSGLFRLKPFDETDDENRAGAVYAESTLLTLGVVASALLTFAALVIMFVAPAQVGNVLGLAVGVSAVTAGIEWHAGLKARAANQLLMSVLAVGAVVLLNHF